MLSDAELNSSHRLAISEMWHKSLAHAAFLEWDPELDKSASN